MELKPYEKMSEVWSYCGKGRGFQGQEQKWAPPSHLSLHPCICPNVFAPPRRSFHVTASRTLDSSHSPTTLLGLLLMRTQSSQATKGVAVYGSGMLNMGGRGACDPNKFQILFPATSGSSCVQALRPFPTSPSSLSRRIVPFHCLVSQGNPRRRV